MMAHANDSKDQPRWRVLRPPRIGRLTPSRSKRNIAEPPVANWVADVDVDVEESPAPEAVVMGANNKSRQRAIRPPATSVSAFHADYVRDDRPRTLQKAPSRRNFRAKSTRQLIVPPSWNPRSDHQVQEKEKMKGHRKAYNSVERVKQRKAPPSRKGPPNSMAKSKSVPDPLTIEVSPGQFLPLRGALETTKAIENDFYKVFQCVCCGNDYDPVFVIRDAEYAICPRCKVVCSLESDEGINGGVGLGFTFETLKEVRNGLL